MQVKNRVLSLYIRNVFIRRAPRCRETPRSPPLSLKGELERSTRDVGGDVGGGGEGRKILDQLTKRISYVMTSSVPTLLIPVVCAVPTPCVDLRPPKDCSLEWLLRDCGTRGAGRGEAEGLLVEVEVGVVGTHARKPNQVELVPTLLQ